MASSSSSSSSLCMSALRWKYIVSGQPENHLYRVEEYTWNDDSAQEELCKIHHLNAFVVKKFLGHLPRLYGIDQCMWVYLPCRQHSVDDNSKDSKSVQHFQDSKDSKDSKDLKDHVPVLTDRKEQDKWSLLDVWLADPDCVFPYSITHLRYFPPDSYSIEQQALCKPIYFEQ